MKIKDIVEHKKGHRAKLYTKKTQQQTTKPGMPQAGVNEDGEAYKVMQNDPTKGLTLAKPDGTQLILPPEKMSSVMADPTDPNKFTMNPDAVADTQTDPNKPLGPAIGADVELAASEDIGGDPTDDFIKDVSVKPHIDGSYNYEASEPDHGTIDIIRNATVHALTNSDLTPEQKDAAENMIVKDANGDIDADKTLIKSLSAFPDAMSELVVTFAKIIPVMQSFIDGTHPYEPKFDTLSPQEQTKYKQDLVDLTAVIARLEDTVNTQKPKIQQSMNQLQSTLASARPQKQIAPIQESADDILLKKMLSIAGLR